MADRISQYVIGLGGDDSDLKSLFAGVKSRMRSDVAELKAITDRVELFGGLSDSLPQVQRALDSAKQRVTQFTADIEKFKQAGEKAPKPLTEGLAAAEKAVVTATRELAKQQQQLTTLDTQLTKAGVNTKSLATEQLRLAQASKAASDAAALVAARQELGLKTLKDVAPEIARQKAAYDALKASGTLSATEIQAAQTKLNANIRELNASVTTTGGSFKSLQQEAGTAFTGLATKVLGATAIMGALGAAFVSVTDAAKSFANSLAQLGTVTNLSDEQLKGLGGQARQLAQELGINVTDALKGLYELIRSGVPIENSIEVLRLSAIAAKAALTDTATGVKASNALLSSFGITTENLGAALDKVTISAKNGGPTLGEFAANAGQLGNAAQAVGANFDEVTGILNVMTNASNDAGGSAAVLTKILINLNKPDVQFGLHRLNLDGLSLAQTLQGIAQKTDGGINAFLDLGLAGTKAAASLSALTNNADKLPAALDKITKSAGAMAEANARIYNTPEEKKKRFDAALEETKIRLGETLGASSNLFVGLTLLLRGFNDLGGSSKSVDAATAPFIVTLGRLVLQMVQARDATAAAKAPVVEFSEALRDGLPALDKTAELLKKAFDSLEINSKALLANTSTIQKSVADQIAAIRDRADTEIALLDKSTAAQVATAAKTLEIQAKANADILKATQDGQAAINAVVEGAIKARTELERKRMREGKGDEEAYNRDVSKIRQDALTADLANAQKFQKELIAQANARVQENNAIERSRVAFNEGIEASIKNIRREGLSGLQQYSEKSQEVDQLIAKAREVAATQGIQAAEKYFAEAKSLSESLRGEVKSDDLVVVSAFESQQKSLASLRKVRDAYNDASAVARENEFRGLNETQKRLDTVGEEITRLQTLVAALRKEASEAIQLTIAEDIRGIDKAREQIAALVKPETKVITVVTQGGGDNAPVGDNTAPPGFNRGGPVWKRFAQTYAAGGPIFRRPGWSKVPGTGDGDTVPALLQAGSFVVRKSASQKYGDSIMSRLVRGYAEGGAVTPASTKGIGSADITPVPAAVDAINYASGIALHLSSAGVMALVKRQIETYIRQLQANRHPDEQVGLIQGMLRSARAAAANQGLENFYGKSALGSVSAFNTNQALPDWYEFIAQQTAAKMKRKGSPYHNQWGFAAGGGVGTDTVPAMLTPGEWVFPKPVVDRLGGRFLSALNNMHIQAPSIPHFATGGPVGEVRAAPASGARVGMGDIHITINAAGGNLNDDRTVRRLADKFNTLIRRSS